MRLGESDNWGIATATPTPFQQSFSSDHPMSPSTAYQEPWDPPSLSAWAQQNVDSPRYIIPGLVPAESKVILTGQKKRGMKSYLSFLMALAIQTGKGPALLRPVKDYVGEPVLVIQEESTRAETKDRCDQLCRGLGANLAEDCTELYFAFHERVKLDSVDWQRKILSFIHRKQPVLVVLDPFYKLHTADENKGAEVMPILDFLEEIRAKGPTTMLVAHLDKSRGENARADIDTQVRGTGMLTDDYDLHLACRRYDMKEEIVKLTTRSKGGADCFYDLKWGFLNDSGKSVKMGQRVKVHKTVLDIVPNMPEGSQYEVCLAKLVVGQLYTKKDLDELWGTKRVKTTRMIARALEEQLLKSTEGEEPYQLKVTI